ncbi:hypothetical protein ACWFPY_17210 [Nocardia fluminea]
METKKKARSDVAKKAADLRTREARKRQDATKATQAAARASSPSLARSKQKEAERATVAADSLGRDAANQEAKAAALGAEIAKLEARIAKADATEAAGAARKAADDARKKKVADRAAEQQRRQVEQELASTRARLDAAEHSTNQVLRKLAAPKPEKLRILMLGASSQGDLRITREHTRIQRAVEAATHRDLVDIQVRLSATARDLQEGIAKFRPHVVHFSGHGDEKLIAFERDVDDFHEEAVVTASAFASACEATDDPPKLIVLNACHSSGTADALVDRFAPMAIGMTDSIDDVDALIYATSLYSAIANGESVASAHAAGRAGIELDGGEHELPHLAVAPGIDPAAEKLVLP